jgi:hypothetical protein
MSAATSTFKIFRHPDGREEVVKVGFSWPALAFGLWWMMAKGLWGWASFWIPLTVAYSIFAFASAETSQTGVGVVLYQLSRTWLLVGMWLVLVLIPAFNGNKWREEALVARGYVVGAMIQDESAAPAFSRERDSTRLIVRVVLTLVVFPALFFAMLTLSTFYDMATGTQFSGAYTIAPRTGRSMPAFLAAAALAFACIWYRPSVRIPRFRPFLGGIAAGAIIWVFGAELTNVFRDTAGPALAGWLVGVALLRKYGRGGEPA